MDAQNKIPSVISDADIAPDAIINTVQRRRMEMLLGISEYKKEERYLMNELAETAVQCKKIESEEKTATDDREAAIIMAGVIGNIGANPFHRASISKVIEGEIVPNFEEPALPDVQTVPDEMSQEIAMLSFDPAILEQGK